jgi:hypothetical protein
MGVFNFKNWEYWPSYMFYLPNIPYAAYLAIRAKSCVFFSATNPAIKHSGNGSESKFSTLELIPTEYKPISVLIKANKRIETIFKNLQKSNIQYPFIIKPDIGFRGLLVKKINSEKALHSYLQKHKNLNLIIQEFIDYKNECGIFYHRIPTEEKGKITSITLKKYLSVIGDGKSTLLELIQKDKRAKKYLDLIVKLKQHNFNNVLRNNEELILTVIGNHSKGTQFINGNHFINPELEESIDNIMQQIPNWFYGRLDLKYNSWEDLLQLKNLKILELNGIISEPTHIYDATSMTYWNALKEIRKHWKIIYKIATINNTKNNIKYDRISDFVKSLKNLKKYTQQMKREV